VSGATERGRDAWLRWLGALVLAGMGAALVYAAAIGIANLSRIAV
jgi:hypothetical protein